MSGIASRTIFVDMQPDMPIKWHDWARVNTAAGTCMEPRCIIAGYGVQNKTATGTPMDPTDDIFRVDAIEDIPIGKEKVILSDDAGVVLHGGQLWQRVGY